MFHGLEDEFRLVLHDPELADPVAFPDHDVARREHGRLPLVMVAAVAAVDDPHAVRLDEAEVPEGRASRRDMGFIAFRQLHRDAERDQAELARLHLYVLSGAQIHPVAAGSGCDRRKVFA